MHEATNIWSLKNWMAQNDVTTQINVERSNPVGKRAKIEKWEKVNKTANSWRPSARILQKDKDAIGPTRIDEMNEINFFRN